MCWWLHAAVVLFLEMTVSSEKLFSCFFFPPNDIPIVLMSPGKEILLTTKMDFILEVTF